MGDIDNNTDNIMKNLDAIKMLSGMMSSGGGSDTEKILNAISTAKSLGLIGNTEKNEKKDENGTNHRNKTNYRNETDDSVKDISISENDGRVEGQELGVQNEGIRVIKAAIPFLNREYQKHLFLAVKLIEMNDKFDRGAMNLQCQSIRENSDEEQMESMLKAVRGQVGNENGRKLDVVLKMMEAKKIVGKLK